MFLWHWGRCLGCLGCFGFGLDQCLWRCFSGHRRRRGCRRKPEHCAWWCFSEWVGHCWCFWWEPFRADICIVSRRSSRGCCVGGSLWGAAWHGLFERRWHHWGAHWCRWCSCVVQVGEELGWLAFRRCGCAMCWCSLVAWLRRRGWNGPRGSVGAIQVVVVDRHFRRRG